MSANVAEETRHEEMVRRGRMARLVRDDWEPSYATWRHGGWYVENVVYPSGAVGCVSRNYPDGKWRIVCAGQDEITYRSRDEAARAERLLALAEYETPAVAS